MDKNGVLRPQERPRSLGRGRGRPRKEHLSIPAHIDQRQIPKGCYWDNAGRAWYTIKEKKRRPIAGADANLATLHGVMERLRRGEEVTAFQAFRTRLNTLVEQAPMRGRQYVAPQPPPTKRNARALLSVGWADKHAIRAIYKRARELTLSTHAQHHVDHIIPLHHPLVCGLHVETNLRILIAEDNMAKSNDWEPYIEWTVAQPGG